MAFRIGAIGPLQRANAFMPIQLEPRSIRPDSAEWPLFLHMSFKYISESWPDRVADKTEEEFKSKYDQTLRQRFEQGGRGVFLYYAQKKSIGLANVFISEEKNEKILNIAEFYVDPLYRKQGFAKQIKDHLVEWGQNQSAIKLKIEVDKHLEQSNRFWSAFGFDLDSSGLRNIYFARI